MKPRVAGCAVLVLAVMVFGARAGAQVSLRSTPMPSITADNEPWYTGGGPISYGGNVYYAAGAITHFSANEMVPAGTFGNVAIYVRTTQEPGSVIYVPLAGGLVKPYERRRSGDLAGTVGSSAPSFPVVLPAEEAGLPITFQAAAPPTGSPVRGFAVAAATPVPAPMAPAAPLPVEEPPLVGTAGRMAIQPAMTRTRVQTVQRPVGLNAVFVTFQGARWYADGPAVELSDRFTQAGEHKGFAVYQQKGQAGVIYLALLSDSAGLIAPYRMR